VKKKLIQIKELEKIVAGRKIAPSFHCSVSGKMAPTEKPKSFGGEPRRAP
jgi:hypothetical protein